MFNGVGVTFVSKRLYVFFFHFFNDVCNRKLILTPLIYKLAVSVSKDHSLSSSAAKNACLYF